MMVITDDFRDAVENGKKLRVRIMLKDSMLVDPTMRQFDEMLNHVSLKMQDLYDEHDGENLKYNRSDWDESYLNSQMVAVVSNFSKERVELLRNIVKHLYRDKAARIHAQENASSDIHITRKQVGMGVAVAGTVVAVVGVCAQQGLMIAGGAVIAAVGVGIILTDKED